MARWKRVRRKTCSSRKYTKAAKATGPRSPAAPPCPRTRRAFFCATSCGSSAAIQTRSATLQVNVVTEDLTMTTRTKLAIFVPLLICAGSAYAGHGHDRDRDDRRDADRERRDHGAYPVTTERCRTEHNSYQEERVVAYDVSYRYQGRLYTTRLPYDPGDRIRVRVHVEPD